MTLRLPPDGESVVLTLPPRVPVREGMAFVEEKAGWLVTQFATLPERHPFLPGSVVPYLDQDHVIRYDPTGGGPVRREAGAIRVAGDERHVPRRVRDWLRAEARKQITARAQDKGRRVGRRPSKITIRDTVSRWGSCTSEGRLAFSWRLIFAPEYVLDYVVAHEVAHLVEMNHGPRFWRLVARLDADAERARDWLDRNAQRLHRYG